MPQPNVCDLLKDQRFEGFLLVRSSDQRTGGNGAKYLDLNLADRTGEVNAKVWDGNVPPPAPGSVVKVRGSTLEYNGRLQLRVERIRAMTPADGVDLSALTPCAPEAPEAMLRELYDAVDAFQSQPLRDLTRELLRRFDKKLRYYPAAQRIHHAERGGLLHHTTGMLRTARAVVGVYPWLNADLLYAGVILHDLCKTEELISDEEIRLDPTTNRIPPFCVAAVVHCPYGAHPSQCYGYYDYDNPMLKEYGAASKTDEDFKAFLDKYVYGVKDHYEYLDKIGASRLLKLKTVPGYGYAATVK